MNDIKVSVIVPCYNVAPYLRQCFDSLVNQALQEIEILAIDNNSTDGTQSIIDEYAAKYPDKIIPMHQPIQGVSAARNLGLDHARGDYVAFVDGDDTLALSALYQLHKTAVLANVDLIVFGVTGIFNDGWQTKQMVWYDIGAAGITDIYKNSKLISNNTTIGNKFYNLDVIKQHNLRFDCDIGFAEDMLFNNIYAFYAKGIYHLREPFCYYFRGREGAATSSLSEKSLTLITALDKVIQFYIENNHFEIFRNSLKQLCSEYYRRHLPKAINAKNKKLANQYIDEFIALLTRHFQSDWKKSTRNYRTDGSRFKRISNWYTTSKRGFTIRRMSPNWLAFGSYHTLRIIGRVYKGVTDNFIVRWIKGNRLARFLKDDARTYLHRKRLYRYYYDSSINEKAILMESTNGDNMNDMINKLLGELSKPEYNEFKIYVSAKKSSVNGIKELLQKANVKNATVVIRETNKYWEVMYTAKYLVNDHTFPPTFIKKEGQVYLNTWHGYPLKCMGRDSVNEVWAMGNVQKNILSADYFLCNSKRMAQIFNNAYMLNNIWSGKFLLAGFPRNDIFFNADARTVIREKLSLSEKKLYAYMPTFRGTYDHKPESLAIRNKHKILMLEHFAELDSSLTDEQILFVSLHPHARTGIDFSQYKHIRPFPDGVASYEFINACDILISDYSSVMYDYVLTGKKVILFAYDQAEYEADRGLYDTIDELPFAKATTAAELLAEINSTEQWDYSALINECCGAEQGTAAQDICRFILLGNGSPVTLNAENNGKDNVLVYGGNLAENENTSAVLHFYDDVDTNEYNYIHCFYRWHFPKRPMDILLVPSTIPLLGVVTGERATMKEMRALNKFKKKKRLNSKNILMLKRLYSREWKKSFGNISFSKILDFEGRTPYNNMLIRYYNEELVKSQHETNT